MSLRSLILTIAFMLFAHNGRPQELPSGTAQEFIFTTAPFASSHASTLVQLRSGELMAAWFGGTGEGKPDVAIWGAVRSEKGWSKPVELVREQNIPCWNPVLFHAKDGRLWLYYKFGPNPASWTGARRWSGDEGKTWSPVEHLPAGILGPIREKPLVEANGHIVSGSSVESYHAWAVWIERSTDDGKSWTKHGPVMGPHAATPANAEGTNGIIQPVIVALAPGLLRLYARATENIGHIVMADTTDDGVTWSATRMLELLNPNSGIDAVRLHDGRVVMIYNDTAHGRTPLNLAVSSDGEHFRNFAALEEAPGEYSYPAIIQERDGSLAATYTWQRTRIRFAHLPLAAIPKE